MLHLLRPVTSLNSMSGWGPWGDGARVRGVKSTVQTSRQLRSKQKMALVPLTRQALPPPCKKVLTQINISALLE